MDSNFPLNLWDEILHQAIITSYLLHASRINPRLSAYAQVHGAFNFNHTPIAPPGTRVLVRGKPSIQETWATHAVNGCYRSPALYYYQCYHMWICETASVRTTDTLSWFPTKVTMPVASPLERATAATQDLISALQQHIPDTIILGPMKSKR